ncbi:GNAT family N-acetyltransferase [Deinococcus metallilatus]|uniref:GNAT family N-acetyltransferase n=1 Tax=Deinococcus metallilatus TaxID=1211322 RepID=A0AAJ5F124_9DEIO|nr:GNAT family N-acetyltransferase [Deinococcus metallilatus]MBB5297005.1 GNAT superfamily N-acetyltransferase [Deinococcus metallilatus]QBY07860.1 GNAT family N-acetyltransferase [Deinococcus metallilatus]RXJ13209.1 GNAT family N-acetyltransferase [Deinococcus metallilatus]TLK23018.1 GNAT family N-acetyltransferase [Deinococcus metallilatus]GMA15971.1 phosphinothricin acetyltransferase [Deinococcus metallilatus]
MSFTVRPVHESEWAAAARVWTLAVPHDPFSAEDFRKRDAEQRGWGYAAFTLLALEGEEVVGVASVYQNPGMYHPHRFTLEGAVHPERQGRGAGRALWERLHAELTRHGAQAVRTLAREDHPLAPGFLTRRGFVGDRRYFTSVLDLTTFDDTPFRELEERLAERGVRVRSLSDLRAAGTPDLTARLHALMSDVRQDVPRSEPATPLSREVFEEAVLGDPGLLPGAYLIAEDTRGAWIGQTTLFRSEASPDLLTGLTGVTRAARGQGVATLLKLYAIRAGRALGGTTIRTDNASDNAPMLAINDRLGFVRDPASVSYVLRF